MKVYIETTDGHLVEGYTLGANLTASWLDTENLSAPGSVQALWKNVVGYSAGDKLVLEGTNDIDVADAIVKIAEVAINSASNAGDNHAWVLKELPYKFLRVRCMQSTITAGEIYLFGFFQLR